MSFRYFQVKLCLLQVELLNVPLQFQLHEEHFRLQWEPLQLREEPFQLKPFFVDYTIVAFSKVTPV